MRQWIRLGGGRWMGVGMVALATAGATSLANAAEGLALPVPESTPSMTAASTRPAARHLAEHVLATGDHGGLPFAVVDKTSARVSVYRGDGSLAGETPVLLGVTPGDQASADVGLRTQTGRLRAMDRTTPAGRFSSRPGQNLSGEAVVWIDYGKALAIHRLRQGPPHERRAERLASPTAADNRISAGCVVVPEAFYDSVVAPVLGRGRGVFYVMPEAVDEASGVTVAQLR